MQTIDDVNVAAMISSLGFSQESKAKQIEKLNGKVKFVYYFKQVSDCGRYKLSECLAAWYDDDFFDENPEHELSIMKIFNLNRLQLLGEIKARQGMITEVEEDGVTALVNLKAEAAELEKLMSS